MSRNDIYVMHFMMVLFQFCHSLRAKPSIEKTVRLEFCFSSVRSGGGNSHAKAYGDVPPKWVTFSPKILRQGSHFGKKKSLEEGPFHKNREKISLF